MKRKAPSDLQQLFPKLRCTDGDLTLIGKSSNKAGNGVMFQVTNVPGRTPLELAKDPFWVNVFNMTPEYHN